MTEAESLERRIGRIEDTLEIQQLAVRYALATDDRDVDSWVELFVPDVAVGRGQVGREALRAVITPQLRLFYRSIHMIVGHRIELLDEQTARGAVYCRAEHEVGQRWIVVAIRYDDDYQKVNGHWHFARRRDRHWYEADVVEQPQSVGFGSWDGAPPRPRLPQASTAWTSFWDGADTSSVTGSPVLGQPQ
jgi:3-phenylpropionate/cinnamic acid dioxygenase small subunit